LQVEPEKQCETYNAGKDNNDFIAIHGQPLCHFNHPDNTLLITGVSRVRL
jgi:hypothetical protein